MSPINGSFIARHLSGVFCLSLEDLKLKILNDIMTNDIMTTCLVRLIDEVNMSQKCD